MEPMIMYGAEVAERMLKNRVWDANKTLYILSNQADPASTTYVRNKQKKCEQVGVGCEVYDISNATLEDVTRIFNDIELYHRKTSYIIIQKPLPEQLKKHEAILDKFFEAIPDADIDAFGGDLSTEFKTPCTPLGIMKMLDYYVGHDWLDGKRAVVIGRSEIVGKPMAQLLLKANCTVTTCHSHTSDDDLYFYLRNADLIVSAVGKPKFITEKYIGERCPVVVDVGINRDENGKLCGDVDFENVKNKCYAISPVPGGVGPLTVASIVYKMGEPK